MSGICGVEEDDEVWCKDGRGSKRKVTSTWSENFVSALSSGFSWPINGWILPIVSADIFCHNFRSALYACCKETGLWPSTVASCIILNSLLIHSSCMEKVISHAASYAKALRTKAFLISRSEASLAIATVGSRSSLRESSRLTSIFRISSRLVPSSS